MCFKNDGKTAQTARCIKSWIITKVIDYVLLIDKFEQQCVVHKVMLKSLCLKYHVQTIGIDQYLSKNFYMNKNFFKTPRNYTNMLVSRTTRNNSKIILSLLWFLLLKDSPITVPYLPGHQHQSINQVLENHCVLSLTY